jgi:hypothetical protein
LTFMGAFLQLNNRQGMSVFYSFQEKDFLTRRT